MFAATASVVAQDGLRAVTMRVLDDISEIDAVVIELAPQPGPAGPNATADDGDRQPSADRNDRGGGSERSTDGRNEDEGGGEGEQREGGREENDSERAPDPPAPDAG
jgi:hypothetical protein